MENCFEGTARTLYAPHIHLGSGRDRNVGCKDMIREGILAQRRLGFLSYPLELREGQEIRTLLPKLTPCPLLSDSWAFGSNSLPIAGSVGMGVARRTQRQFPMPPRALPPGRMGLLSPSGIGGVSPRHALTSPSLGGQGRQVSQLVSKSKRFWV